MNKFSFMKFLVIAIGLVAIFFIWREPLAELLGRFESGEVIVDKSLCIILIGMSFAFLVNLAILAFPCVRLIISWKSGRKRRGYTSKKKRMKTISMPRYPVISGHNSGGKTRAMHETAGKIMLRISDDLCEIIGLTKEDLKKAERDGSFFDIGGYLLEARCGLVDGGWKDFLMVTPKDVGLESKWVMGGHKFPEGWLYFKEGTKTVLCPGEKCYRDIIREAREKGCYEVFS